MLASLIASVLASHAPSLCGDISGEWTSGWAPGYNGSGKPASQESMMVRGAVTPYGTPHAQYVVDYEAALALHPDLQTCLGNGTCSQPQFGRARALNSTSPDCTFIEWPASDRQTNGGWCKVPFCPLSPQPTPPTPPAPFPPFKVTWKPTYDMSRSTITNPNGSPFGPDKGATLKQDSRFGIIAFDGGDMDCMNYRLGPPEDPCMYAKTWSNFEVQARQIKAVSPDTHVWHYRNMQLRLTRNEFDCPKMYDPSYAGYFLHNKDGSYLNSTADATWIRNTCAPSFPNATYPSTTAQYYLDWRNESARNWWLDIHIGSIINSTVVDGFYWDDPVFGNEGMWIRDQYTPEELADIDSSMHDARLEAYNRLSRSGGFCTGSTCYTAIPDVANCVCTAPHSNCTCDDSRDVVTQNVKTAQSRSGSAVLLHIPYPYEFHRLDGGPYNVTCSGPAVVQWKPDPTTDPPHAPHSVQLSCLPGTGAMTVDFASFGLPTIGRGVPVIHGRGIRTADCSAFAVNSSCDAGATVLQQLKALCDGKQSCRFDTSHPIFTRPASGCGDLPVSALQLAVRASGCEFGTGSGIILNFREQLAMFLLARGDHWWMGNDWIAAYPPVFLPEWDVDYGIPISNLTVVDGVLSRQWSKMEVRLDANTFEATFDLREGPLCSLGGEWVSGWGPNYSGGATVPAPTAHRMVMVRDAVTPYGTPHAQYVVDYEAALALHPDLQTCLGNGTCSQPQFGRARALNSTSPDCTFIEWPASDRQTNGGWCKVPFCPAVPPPPPQIPKFNLTWKPTYDMARSTISNPNGNLTGSDVGAALAVDAKYGIIAFDGGFQACLNLRTPPLSDPCKYAHTIDDIETQARSIKAINPSSHVFSYRNMQLGLSRNQHDCSKMYDPAYSGYWIQNKSSGKPLNDALPLAGFATQCAAFAPASAYTQMDSFFLDWRNASAREWWLDVKLGSLLRSSLIDGFFWDDPAFGNEHEAIKNNLTPEEVADVAHHMQLTRVEGADRAMAAGKWCIGSTCWEPLPGITCTPEPQCAFRNERPANCVCNTSKPALKQMLTEADARSGAATLASIPYIPDSEDDRPVCASGPAVVAVTGAPTNSTFGSVQLSCLPGHGEMVVDFASFGLPIVATTAASSGAQRANCSAFARNASCDAGPGVIARVKQLCDGKQSCRLNLHDPAFQLPAGCGGGDGAALNPLRLAVRASGCTPGTGGSAHANFRESLAAFLLTRGDHAWFGHGFIGNNLPVWFPEWSVDYGTPLGPMKINQVDSTDGGMATIATRPWSKFDISLNLDTYEATFDPRK